MADVHSKAARSYNMSRIRAKDTGPEMLVRKFLHANGFRYTLHNKALPGKPDLVFPKLKTVVFVNGCFWHGHDECSYATIPKTRTAWWQKKIDGNRANDAVVRKKLKQSGWKVIDVWGCDLKKTRVTGTLQRLLSMLNRRRASVNHT